MYFEYWNLQKPPFDNVPDPTMYADCHVSMENAIAETLFAIEEGNECLAVIIGDVGLGKTLSLRIIIDSLDPGRYLIALITNPSLSFVQLMNEIIGQLTGRQWNEKKKVNLLETFNKLIFQTTEEGKKIVLLIDEANALSPSNLENLRLLTNMQDDHKNLFTIVLAGQIELARRLEDPRRANLFQRIGTYSRIEKIPSVEALRTYVETRLRLAGAVGPIFTEDTFPLFWKYSEEGVPRLINKIAKLSLKAGETYGLRRIDGRIVSQVGKQFEKTVVTGRGKGKKRKEEAVPASDHPLSRPSFLDMDAPPMGRSVDETVEAKDFDPLHLLQPASVLAAAPAERPTFETDFSSSEIAAGETPSGGTPRDSEKSEGVSTGLTPSPRTPWAAEKETDILKEEEGRERESSLDIPPCAETPLEEQPSPTSFAAFESAEQTGMKEPPEPVEAERPAAVSPEGVFEEFHIDKFKVRVHLPAQFIAKALSSSEEERLKMAGEAAVQAIKKFIQMTSTPLSDPVNLWSELRSNILKRLEVSGSQMAA